MTMMIEMTISMLKQIIIFSELLCVRKLHSKVNKIDDYKKYMDGFYLQKLGGPKVTWFKVKDNDLFT